MDTIIPGIYSETLTEREAQAIYKAVKELRGDARYQIMTVLGLNWPLRERCPCGKRLHYLSEFLGTPIRIKGFREVLTPEPGVIIRLRWLDDEEHEAYWSKDILGKLERLLRSEGGIESIPVAPWLKLDLEVL